MLHVSVTGIEPKGVLSLISVYLGALDLARSARKSHGCCKATVFVRNGRVFVYAVWDAKANAKAYEAALAECRQMAALRKSAKLADSHAFVCRALPNPGDLASMWSTARYVMAT